jgi:hypothetical protein
VGVGLYAVDDKFGSMFVHVHGRETYSSDKVKVPLDSKTEIIEIYGWNLKKGDQGSR